MKSIIGFLQRVFKMRILKSSDLMIVAAFTLLISSCERGFDGHPGNAYLAIDWELQQPEYLDAGTGSIPPVFEWGKFYFANPGFYEMYYEGTYWNGIAWGTYAWDVEYEIWRNEGESGGFGYDGRNGADSYLTIVCSPNGPYFDRLNKSLSVSSDLEVLESTDSLIVVENNTQEFGIKITYRKVNSNLN